MKTNFLLFLIASSLGLSTGMTAPAGTSPAKALATTAGSPKIRFATPVFDFGKVSAGELVKHSFIFTNTGNATLEILDVKPGCGCTTAGTWDKEVAPGKTGSIPLQFNSANFSGRVAKTAAVTSNDPEQPSQILQITGTVWKPIEVTPTMAFFNVSNESTTNETKVIRIINNTDEPLTVSDLQLTNPVFRAELKTVLAGKEFAIHVTPVPPFNTRVVSTPITLKTSSAQMPVIYATAYLNVQQAVVVMPSQLFIPAGPLPGPAIQSLSIRNTGTSPLTISDVAVNVPEAQVTVQEAQPGRVFNLSVKFPAGFQIQPNQHVEVTAKSNHPQFPVIKVPVLTSQRPFATPGPVAGRPNPQLFPANLPGPVTAPPAQRTTPATEAK